MKLVFTLQKPIITEQSITANKQNRIIVKVDRRATKPQIKQAIEDLVGGKVISINTSNTEGKVRRVGRSRRHQVKDGRQKKAYIQLENAKNLEVFTTNITTETK